MFGACAGETAGRLNTLKPMEDQIAVRVNEVVKPIAGTAKPSKAKRVKADQSPFEKNRTTLQSKKRALEPQRPIAPVAP